MVKLALTGPLERWAPMGGSWSSSPTATLSLGAGDHLRRGDRGGGAGPKPDRNAPRRTPSPHKRECKFLRPRKTPLRALSVNKSARGRRSLHQCSLCLQHLLRLGRRSRRVIFLPWAQKPTGSTMAPSARVRHGFLSGPIPPALFTSTISRTPER